MRVMQDEPTKRVLSDTRNVNRGWLSATKIRDGGVVDRWMGDEAEAGASASASAGDGRELDVVGERGESRMVTGDGRRLCVHWRAAGVWGVFIAAAGQVGIARANEERAEYEEGGGKQDTGSKQTSVLSCRRMVDRAL